MRRHLFMLAIAVAAVVSAPSSSAQPAGDAAAATEAVEVGKRALVQYEAGHYAESHRLFARADQLMHSPVFVLYMARCKRELGKLREARALYQWVIGEQLDESAPAPWKQAQQDARIEHQQLSERIAAEGADPDVPRPPSDPPAQGPNAADDSEGGSIVPGVVVAAVGAVGLAVGGILGALALSKADEAKQNCLQGLCPSEDLSLKEDAESLAHGSTAAFVIGSLAVAAGVTLILLRPGGDEQTVALTVAPGALTLSGRF